MMPSTTFWRLRTATVGRLKTSRSMRGSQNYGRSMGGHRTLSTSCGMTRPLATSAFLPFSRCEVCEPRTSTRWQEKASCLRGCIPKSVAHQAEPLASPVAMPFVAECTTSACWGNHMVCATRKSLSPKCFPKPVMLLPSMASGISATSKRATLTSRDSMRRSSPATTKFYR